MQETNQLVNGVGGESNDTVPQSRIPPVVNPSYKKEMVALDDVASIDSEISALSGERLNGVLLYSRVASLITGLSSVISKAENCGVDKDTIKNAITKSRRVFSQSPYVNRMQTWPRGYQGDFETVEMISAGVENIELKSVGDCVEYYAQTLPISQQHRNKLSFQQALAMNCLRNNQNIMSIGCGGAIDICKALEFFPDYAGSITFIDMDEEAIELVRKRTAGFDCKYITKNIVRGLGAGQSNSFHLVLCGGLFDYLDDKVADLVLRQIKKKLVPDGRLFLTNIAKGNPFRVQMEYLGDWVLIERSEEELEQLIRKSFGESSLVDFERDYTGLAILATVSLQH
jgi:SAM-dependent methyltransferase